jgi:hypothetical protein
MNETSLNHCILAIVCRRPEKVSGACPTFIAASQEEQQNICLLLARILVGSFMIWKTVLLLLLSINEKILSDRIDDENYLSLFWRIPFFSDCGSPAFGFAFPGTAAHGG